MAEVAPTIDIDSAARQHEAALRHMVEDGLTRLALPSEPAELYDPVRYALGGGGKRLRPVLLLLAAEAGGGDASDALPAALAAEVFHTFTLVHDDIMDHAAERRGRPSVHTVWNESTAILAGDLLMGLSYDLLARTPTRELASLIRVFHRMVMAVCEGQALDEAFETRDDVTVADYVDMIGRKTAALLVCVMELGARVGGADAETTLRLTAAGNALGHAFQIQDDLLDLTADDAGWGKVIGGDLIEGKKSYLLLRALEVAPHEDRRFFQRILANGGLEAALVPDARRRMERLGVLADAAEAVLSHTRLAERALTQLPPSQARHTLIWLTRRLASRGR